MKRTFATAVLLVAACTGLFGLGGTLKKKIGPSAEQQTIVIAFTANQKGLHAAGQTDAPASAYETVLAAVRKAYANAVFVHLGNFMGPTPSTIVSKGKLDFQMVDRQMYNLLHLSNHEFVVGTEELRKRIGESRIPVLSGNIDIPKSAARRWITVKRDARTVGFLGLTSDQFPGLVNENLRPDVTLDPVASYADNALRELKGKVDVVVALSDLSDQELENVRSIDGIDLIISSGGSAGTGTQEWISIAFPESNKATVVRMIPSFPAVYVLELTLTKVGTAWILDELNGDYYPVTAKTARDKALDQWVTGQYNSIRSKEAEKIGDLAAVISNERVREQRSELGATVTNLMRNLTRAHVAALNAGSLRDSLPKGPVTHWDLIEAMPYPSYLVVKRMTGAQLEAVIQKSQALVGKGGYLQWSGLETNQPGLGNAINGARIQPEKQYEVVMLDYLAMGGDGYTEFAAAPTVRKLPMSLQELCLDYFRRYGTLILPKLPLDRESNFWFGAFKASGTLDAIVSDPDNALNYPDQPSLVSQQYVSAQGAARLDLNRRSWWFGFDNSVEAQFGMNWDNDLKPGKSLDQVRIASQLTLYSSNFLFKGMIPLDPYVSGALETVILFPDPFLESDIDPYTGLPYIRPGSLQLAAGIETSLLGLFTIKFGFRRQSQPFDDTVLPQAGFEGILSFAWYPWPDVLGFESRTEAFTNLDWEGKGLTLSSQNSIIFGLGQNLRLVPTAQLYYNTVMDELAYLLSTRLEFNLAF
ncbi:MAG: 5'-nucleotidase C-terminal domain-containing protein [Spirochaetes bacterium]|nr:5'-nucleotidase C-terminal domain-containing protein [Spirochaetota bacterium]